MATRNAHKVGEIRAILSAFEVLDLSVLNDPPEVEETGRTFLENATLKALAISELTDALVLSDDSGLEVDSLGGDPGVYSSRYAGEDGNDSLNNEKLLREMDGHSERTARFRCVIVLARGGNVLADFSGAVEGRILREKQGRGVLAMIPCLLPKAIKGLSLSLAKRLKMA